MDRKEAVEHLVSAVRAARSKFVTVASDVLLLALSVDEPSEAGGEDGNLSRHSGAELDS